MGNTPNVRFKGFTEDWEQRKLEEVCSEIGDGLHSAPEYDDSGKFFFINGNNLINGHIVINSNETKRVSENTFEKNNKQLDDNTVLLSINGTIGNLAYYQGEPVMLGKSAAYLKANKIDKTFLYSLLQTTAVMNNFMLSLTGTTIKNLGLDAIKKTKISIPELREQERIGLYFSQLDHLITLHQQKCDEIKELKKYMLQNMFPQKDEKVPKIRFDGFTGDWEQRKVSEIGNIITGSTPKTSISDNYGGEFLFVSPADIQGNRYVDETITTLTKKGFDQGRKIRKRASLFVSIGSTIGKVAQTSQESTTNQQINAVEPYDNFDDDFIFTSLENISGSIKAIASNQAVPIVNKTTFGETEIQVPSELEEQQKIGAYFRNLDHLITLHQQKCAALKEFKKYTLQNMFPQKGENKCQN